MFHFPSSTVTKAKRKYEVRNWEKSIIKFTLSEEEINEIYDVESRNFRKGIYVDFFSRKLNGLGITCVLAASQKKGSTAHFYCLHQTCSRNYRVQAATIYEEFSVEWCGDINHVKRGVARPLNGIARIREREKIATLKPKEYRKISRSNADKALLRDGNLQGNLSSQTIYNLKQEALKYFDLDPDHIKDLTKLKKQQEEGVANKVEGAEQYIRWVVADPFVVMIFSDEQMKVIHDLMKEGVQIVLHVDATGSVVAQPDGIDTKVYYYVASVALTIQDEEEKLLFPVMEMISSSHDAFTISTWFNHFSSEFYKKYDCHPLFHDFVTDFSFAILNAAAKSFNGTDLIDLINKIYEVITATNPSCPPSLLKFLIHICCNHFMKTTTKDINLYFPVTQSSNIVRVFLKETLAMFFNLSTMESITEAYRSLSVILNSKYITSDVTNAITALTLLSQNTDAQGHRIDTIGNMNENDDELDPTLEEEILTFDEPKDSSMYKRSLFYQKFNTITSSGFYDDSKSNKLNNFYCPEYCKLLLKKYMAILPLWTCLNNRKRFSNSNSENIFRTTKQSLTLSAAEIGQVPLRASRFIKFTRKYVKETLSEYEDQIPRRNNCGRKRKAPNQTPRNVKRTKPSPPFRLHSPSSAQYPASSARRPSYLSPISEEVTTPIIEEVTTPIREEVTTPRSSSRLRKPSIRLRPPMSSVSTPSPRVNTLSPICTPTSQASLTERPSTLTNQSTVVSFYTPTSFTPSRTSLRTPHRKRGRPKNGDNEGIDEEPLTINSPSIFDIDSPHGSPMENPLINQHAEESRQPRKKSVKWTYFTANLLKNFTEPKVLNKIFNSNDKRVSKGVRLTNHLFDDPSIYIKPTEKFIVARVDRKSGPLLENVDFKCLDEGQLTIPCAKFILTILRKKYKQIQYEIDNSLEIINPSTTGKNLIRILKDNFIGIVNVNGVYSVIVINFTKRRFSYFDPTLIVF